MSYLLRQDVYPYFTLSKQGITIFSIVQIHIILSETFIKQTVPATIPTLGESFKLFFNGCSGANFSHKVPTGI